MVFAIITISAKIINIQIMKLISDYEIILKLILAVAQARVGFKKKLALLVLCTFLILHPHQSECT